MKRGLIGLMAIGISLGEMGCESQRSSSAPASVSPAVSTSKEEVTIEPVNPGLSSEEAIQQIKNGPFSDTAFVAKAAEMGMAEVELSLLAEDQAVDPAVKDYGVEMQAEHRRANSILINLSNEKKWYTPKNVNAEHKDAYANLLQIRSDKFDRRYMEQMIRDHEIAVALFGEAIKNATDPELRRYAIQTEPSLRDHLTKARAIMKNLDAKK
ncbi:DUF4142 domain-containing protein [Adhaeribacter soli]|uniref:DUF4142 domain-containing protein n=1 Tax=Adhaeribacter soli TaxID=2607655 RepID=A0A5N1J0S8_9BACT|nr:DUF4142 domain-containing protein [Adhaeribacter soli]KAA9340240.1 DUF4142 domain-containing protein [Adhaeribacter soli]